MTRSSFKRVVLAVTASAWLVVGPVAWAGFLEGAVAYERGDFETAFREYKLLAERAHPMAQYNLGRMYAQGRGVAKDQQKAVYWIRKAAETGDPDAQHDLGVMYANGEGLPVDEQQAVYWYRKSAEQGDAMAQYKLARRYFIGQGVAEDMQQAVSWYRKAAEQGHELAQLYLGQMYVNGLGVAKDEQQAIFWCRKAAEQGNATAQHILGGAYFIGDGVARDFEAAVNWYRKAAEQGRAAAQVDLARAYSRGLGVVKDEQRAAHWLRQAAEQGHAQAQYGLGLTYYSGSGVPKDEQQAYFWMLLSSAAGDESAKNMRDRMEEFLSPSQRSDAQVKARNWRPRIAVAAENEGSPQTGGTLPTPALPPDVSPAAPESTGSGFAIGRDLIVTNAHVVEGCARVMVGGRGAGTVRAVDARSDLALLSVKSGEGVATLRSGRLRQGEQVNAVGFPLRGVLATGVQVTSGNVSALAGIRNDIRFIQITAPVQPGNSGGPLVDSSGNVVGVVVSKLNAVKVAELTGDIPQNVNFAISPLVLQGFLDANGVEYKSLQSTRRLSTADATDIAKKYTVLVECWK